tara:strand:+ start:737 stop:1117 length:381 start_codon:yes stop_codon:yes gene_type:complete
MLNKTRWVLLKHIGSPSDPNGCHFDLLLEDRSNCRSWRLEQIPNLEGPALTLEQISPHNLSWLDTNGKSVSGGRGWASPIASGYFLGELPAMNGTPFAIELCGETLNGRLEIYQNQCVLRSSRVFS